MESLMDGVLTLQSLLEGLFKQKIENVEKLKSESTQKKKNCWRGSWRLWDWIKLELSNLKSELNVIHKEICVT